MSRPNPHTPLSELDLMIIRAGGQTQAELEASARTAFGLWRPNCACLADAFYRIVMRLEAGANRPEGTSHRRFVDDSGA